MDHLNKINLILFLFSLSSFQLFTFLQKHQRAPRLLSKQLGRVLFCVKLIIVFVVAIFKGGSSEKGVPHTSGQCPWPSVGEWY